MPIRADTFYKAQRKNLVFVDLESYSTDYSKLAQDPVKMYSSLLGMKYDDVTVIAYSKSLASLDAVMSQLSIANDNFYYYVIPKKTNHEVVDKAIIQDVMYVSAKILKFKRVSTQSLHVISDDDDFCELMNHVQSLGIKSTLVSSREKNQTVLEKEGFVQVIIVPNETEIAKRNLTLEHPINDSVQRNVATANVSSAFVNLEQAANSDAEEVLSDAAVNGDLQIVTGRNRAVDPEVEAREAFRSHGKKLMNIAIEACYDTSHNTWFTAAITYFRSVEGSIATIQGSGKMVKIFEYSQFCTFVHRVVHLPTGSSGRRAAMMHIARYLCVNQVIIVYDTPMNIAGRPSRVQFQDLDDIGNTIIAFGFVFSVPGVR
jgi:hypothetical protein